MAQAAQPSSFAVRGGTCPLNERKRCTCAPRGMCALAAWAAGMGKWIMCSCREFTGAKPKRDFSIRQAHSLQSHTCTHTSISSPTRQIDRQEVDISATLVPASQLMQSCCFLLDSLGEETAPFLSCLLHERRCVFGGDRRFCSVRPSML